MANSNDPNLNIADDPNEPAKPTLHQDTPALPPETPSETVTTEVIVERNAYARFIAVLGIIIVAIVLIVVFAFYFRASTPTTPSTPIMVPSGRPVDTAVVPAATSPGSQPATTTTTTTTTVTQPTAP